MSSRGYSWFGRAARIGTGLLGVGFLVVTTYLTLETSIVGDGVDVRPMPLEALRSLSAGEVSDAEAAAQKDFAQNPLSARSLVQLSRIAETRGNEDVAARLKLMAGELQPRALGVQAEALSILLRRGNFADAMTRLDGLIRARPSDRPQLFRVVSGIAAEPQGVAAVARTLAADPPWRRDYLADTLSADTPAITRALMTELRALGAPPTDAEVSLVIDYHLARGAVDDAYAAWLSSLNPGQLDKVRLVYDGGFQEQLRNLKFDWTVKSDRGLAYRLFPRNTATMNMSLEIELEDFEGPFQNLSQLLLLRAGRYRLSGDIRFDEFESGAAMVFSLYCLDGGKATPLAKTAPLPQSSQWINFEKNFDVPSSGCYNQILKLESGGPLDASSRSRGRFAIDDVSIDLLPAIAQ